MPSPFPGMDPWLEDPARWPGVHFWLIAAVQQALNRAILPKHFAAVENRPALVRTAPARSVRGRRVEVRERDGGRVVAVVEILSPANKRAGSRGRAGYLRKRREVLRSETALVEIDLLRAGRPSFPRPAGRPADYAVHVSPDGLRPDGYVWAVPLESRLPTVAVPLRSPDPDVPLDLGSAFAAAYDLGSLQAVADYGRDPVPPLPPERATWATDILRAASLR